MSDLTLGQLVAVQHQSGGWHRAEVKEIQEPSSTTHPDQHLLDLYCVDYGDSTYTTLNKVRRLDKNFYSLPLQAIECKISDIELNDGKTEWSDEDICLFEDLCYSCRWKKLKLTFLGYETVSGQTRRLIVRLYDKIKVFFQIFKFCFTYS